MGLTPEGRPIWGPNLHEEVVRLGHGAHGHHGRPLVAGAPPPPPPLCLVPHGKLRERDTPSPLINRGAYYLEK